jgi:hypothetical protein
MLEPSFVRVVYCLHLNKRRHGDGVATSLVVRIVSDNLVLAHLETRSAKQTKRANEAIKLELETFCSGRSSGPIKFAIAQTLDEWKSKLRSEPPKSASHYIIESNKNR